MNEKKQACGKLVDELYKQISRLKVENDWLKTKRIKYPYLLTDVKIDTSNFVWSVDTTYIRAIALKKVVI